MYRARYFNNQSHFDNTVQNLTLFEKRLQQYFVEVCHKLEHINLVNTRHVAIKGYYVENKKICDMYSNDEALIIYIELLPISNKMAVSGLYKWEDKLNELRVSTDSDGLHGASD